MTKISKVVQATERSRTVITIPRTGRIVRLEPVVVPRFSADFLEEAQNAAIARNEE